MASSGAQAGCDEVQQQHELCQEQDPKPFLSIFPLKGGLRYHMHLYIEGCV